jgi:glycosyltransferase involved in cell wall biosynthesis
MLSDREYNLATAPPETQASPSIAHLGGRYDLDQGHRIILYAGTFEAYQGLDLLVDAAPAVLRAHPDVRFLCLGGHPEQIATMQARARERGVAQYFVCPGTVPPDDVEPHFRIASVLVSPRISGTNTPLKIYSYLRSGVPILATNIVSHTQVLTPDVALLVEPQLESFAAGIVRLLDDAQLGRRLAQNALRLAQESYSPEAYHAKMAEVCAFLASRARKNNTPPEPDRCGS